MVRYANCVLCGSWDYAEICPAFYKDKKMDFGRIVMCGNCGLVYKTPIVSWENAVGGHYKSHKAWKSRAFRKKYARTAEYLKDKIKPKSTVLDIGAATGEFLSQLSKRVDINCVAIEPSRDVAAMIKRNVSRCVVLPGAIESVNIGGFKPDFTTALGVDYLFVDHDTALYNISNMSAVGKFYIERNVFLEMKSFVGSPVRTKADLFGTNSMINYWFTEEQFDLQLAKYFHIDDKWKYMEGGSEQIGWLCSMGGQRSVDIPNHTERNMKILKRLK
jgi:hypothetical protein